jgi:hypothetical protein
MDEGEEREHWWELWRKRAKDPSDEARIIPKFERFNELARAIVTSAREQASIAGTEP